METSLQNNLSTPEAEAEAKAEAIAKTEGSAGKRRSPSRVANAWAALILVVIFCAHALLGALKQLVPGLPSALAWVVWVGVGAIVVHLILSGITTYDMWTDRKRPASPRKKRHQYLKWISGAAVLVCAAAHMLVVLAPGLFPGSTHVLRHVLMIALAAALCWHIFISAKSLLKDLWPGATKRARNLIRAAVVVFFCGVGAIILAALW